MKHITPSQVLSFRDLTQQICIPLGARRVSAWQKAACHVCLRSTAGDRNGPRVPGHSEMCSEVTPVTPSPSSSKVRSAALPLVWVISIKNNTIFIPAIELQLFHFPQRACLNVNAERSILSFFSIWNILSEHANLFCMPFQGTSTFSAYQNWR